jgi:hypothetical protein
MADPLLNIAYDAASLGTIARFSHFQSILESEMSGTMTQVGALVVQSAVANTWAVFQNPTGNLADHIAAQLSGPMEVVITVGVPYAWRLEAGFVGADSLGRVYHQAPEPYAMPALVSNEDQIVAMLGNAAAEAFVKIGGA